MLAGRKRFEWRGHTISVLKDWDDIAGLADEWNELAVNMGSPLLEFPWFWSAACELHDQDVPHIIMVRREGQLVGLAPLVGTPAKPKSPLEIIGTRTLAEPSGLLYRDDTALDALCQALVRTRRPLALFRIQTPDKLRVSLQAAARARCLLIWRPSNWAPWADLSRGFDAYLAGRSSRRRSDLRRAERRLREFGNFSVKILTPSVEGLTSKLDSLFAVESRGWKGRNGSAILKRPLLERFIRTYCRLTAKLGILRLCTLEVNGKIAAMQIAVVQSNRFWVLKIGYDEHFARASPGLFLTIKTMEECAKQGLVSYEFLGFNETWLSPWSNGVRGYAVVMIYPATTSGVLCLLSDGTRYITRRLRRHHHVSASIGVQDGASYTFSRPEETGRQ